jgi:hypothetical protein
MFSCVYYNLSMRYQFVLASANRQSSLNAGTQIGLALVFTSAFLEIQCDCCLVFFVAYMFNGVYFNSTVCSYGSFLLHVTPLMLKYALITHSMLSTIDVFIQVSI